MLGEVFYWLFNMSVVSALVGSVVLLLRRIKKIPRRVITYLWVIPFLRMCVPVGMGGKYGLMSLLSHFATKTIVVYEPRESLQFSIMNCITVAKEYSPITYKVNLLEQVFFVGAVVWLTVAFVLLIAFTTIYIMTLREIKDAEHIGNHIYLSDKIQSPAVYGIIRPKIILPKNRYRATSEEDLLFVLLHEKVHIKSMDNLRRLKAFVITFIYWFNPFAWVFLRYYLADLEHSCDEKVLARCGEDKKKSYALSLINNTRPKNVFASAFGGANIRLRMDHILSYKKLSVISLIGFVALVAVMAYVLLTNAL